MNERAVLLAILVALGAGWGITQPLAKLAVSEGYRHFGIIFWQQAITAAALSLVLLPAGAGARDIKVGVIDCYSGPPAVYGKDALNGFKLALEEINAKGVLGQKIT